MYSGVRIISHCRTIIQESFTHCYLIKCESRALAINRLQLNFITLSVNYQFGSLIFAAESGHDAEPLVVFVDLFRGLVDLFNERF